MVIFMLDDPGRNAMEDTFMLHEIFVHIAEAYVTCTLYIFPHFGYAEATLIVRPKRTGFLYFAGINKHLFCRFLIWIFRLILVIKILYYLYGIYDKQAYGAIDLGGSKTNPIAIIQGVPHIAEQLWEIIVGWCNILANFP